MTEADLETWLRRYGGAWEARDPDAAASLFSEDAEYFETPFLEPARGREGIQTYWANATGKQKEVRFGFEILACSEKRGIARWWADIVFQSDVAARLDGVFLLDFAADGRCRALREWWHRRETSRKHRPGRSSKSRL